jgi:hypothetical protein
MEKPYKIGGQTLSKGRKKKNSKQKKEIKPKYSQN